MAKSKVVPGPERRPDPTPSPEQAFAATAAGLDAGVPLLLLPVRLETRFEPEGAPTTLRIRVYPDALHADVHAPQLSPAEAALAAEFAAQWRRTAKAADKEAAFARLAAVMPPWRAAWVARVGLGLSAPGPGHAQETAALLPDRWLFVGYRRGKPVFQVAGSAIPANLPSGLADLDRPDGQEMVAWMKAQGLGWMVDFDEAVRKGMAVAVPLTGDAASDGLDELFVVGLRPGAAPVGAAALQTQLEALHYGRGACFARQGAPTNRTEGELAADPWADPARVARGELDPAPVTRGDAPFVGANAWVLSQALGLGPGTVLDRLQDAHDDELTRDQAALRALWHGTAEHLLDTMLARDGKPFLADATRAWLYRWATDHLRAGGPLPTLRVGAEPFGVLPVSLLASPVAVDAPIDRLTKTLVTLTGMWEHALPSVPTLDPTATDDATDPGQAAREALTAILSGQPHPVRLAARLVSDEVDKVFVDGIGAQNVLVALIGAFDSSLTQADLLHSCETILRKKTTGLPTIDKELDARVKNGPTIDRQLIDWQGVGAWIRQLVDTATRKVAEVTQAEGGVSQAKLNAIAAQLGKDVSKYAALSARISAMAAALDAQKRLPQLLEARTLVSDMVCPLLAEHEARVEPLEHIDLGAAAFSTNIGASQPALAQSGYSNETVHGKARLLQDETAGPTALVSAWLPAMAAAVRTGAQPAPLAGVTPLLHRLLRQGGARTPPALRAEVAAAIDLLAGRARDPADDLPRLIGGALGLVGYRLDAWLTGVAASRLAALRQRRPTGLCVGAFGFVEKLRPAARVSQGYIHAPSPGQAATAAVLRTGWSAWASDQARDALAVDLSSDRVRVASWLLDGMRQGQTLGALLGYRFERRLHDATPPLDRHIDDLRAAVGRGLKGSKLAAAQTIDGLALAQAWAGDPELTAVKHELDAAVQAAKTDGPALKLHLTALAGDIDAVSDLSLAEGVHAALHGNPERAGAILDAVGAGQGAPPELRLPGAPRTGIDVTHRLVLLLPGTPAPVVADPARRSPRALLEPRLDAWIAGLLGAAARVSWTAIHVDAATGVELTRQRISLTALELEAADLVRLAPPAGSLAGSELEARALIAARLARPNDVPPDASVRLLTDRTDLPADHTSLDELTLLLDALRELLSLARPLDAPDLVAPGVEAASTADFAELRQRLASASLPLAALVAALGDLVPAAAGQDVPADRRTTASALLVRQLLLAWRMGLPDALPRAGLGDLATTGGDPGDRLQLLAQARAVLAAARLRHAEVTQASAAAAASWAAWTSAEQRRWIGEQVGRVAPGAAALPLFTVVDGATLDASFARTGPRHATDPGLVAGWLDQVARVQPGAAALHTVGLVADALADARALALAIAQLPDRDGEPWAAVARPTDDRPRICVTAASAGAVRFVSGGAAQPIAGLVLDQWVETIPHATETTGLALHWNAPGAQAPQLALLAVPGGGAWSQGELIDLLRQTLRHARIRAIEPDRLTRMGHYLPAVFLPKLSATSAPVAEEVL